MIAEDEEGQRLRGEFRKLFLNLGDFERLGGKVEA
jgi:hypothetical protein